MDGLESFLKGFWDSGTYIALAPYNGFSTYKKWKKMEGQYFENGKESLGHLFGCFVGVGALIGQVALFKYLDVHEHGKDMLYFITATNFLDYMKNITKKFK